MAITTRDLGQRTNTYPTPGFIEARGAPTDTLEGRQWGDVHSEGQDTDLKMSIAREYVDAYLKNLSTLLKARVSPPTFWQEPPPPHYIGIDPTSNLWASLLGRTARPDKRSYDIEALEESLRRIADLHPSWDSYNAPRIASHVVDEAKGILLCVVALGLPQPWVAPGADGGIGIQWDTEVAELYIDIVPGEPTSYLLTLNVGSSKEVEVDEPLTLTNLSRVLTQFAEAIR